MNTTRRPNPSSPGRTAVVAMWWASRLPISRRCDRLMFAGLARVLSLESSGKLLGLGVGWGVATWVLFAALLMPVWLGAVGSPASPPFPNFAPPSLLWHVVYGAVLAVVYAVTADRI